MIFGVGKSPQVVQAPRAGISGLHPYYCFKPKVYYGLRSFDIIIGQPYSALSKSRSAANSQAHFRFAGASFEFEVFLFKECRLSLSSRVTSRLAWPFNPIESLRAENPRQHGSDFEHVHVLPHNPAAVLYNPGHTWAVCRYQRAADSDCLWLATHHSSARPCSGENHDNPISRFVWHHTDTGSV